MIRTRKWAAGAVVAAGLTGACAAWAEPPAVLPPPLAAAASGMVDTAHTLDPRDLEMLVELDLMADQVTFPHVIKAHMTPQGLELKGYVPSDTVRKRALAIAGNTAGKVHDRLQLQSKLLLPLPLSASASMADEVGKRIARVSPTASRRIEVTVATGGLVILSGEADSLEQKWKMSQSLRGLNGCLAVKNDLEVPGILASSVRVPGESVRPAAGARPTAEASAPRPVRPEIGVPQFPMLSVDVVRPLLPPTPTAARPTPPPVPVIPTTYTPSPKAVSPSPSVDSRPAFTPPGKAMTTPPGNPVGLTKSPYGGEPVAVLQPPPARPHEMPKMPVAPAKPAGGLTPTGGAPALVSFDDEPATLDRSVAGPPAAATKLSPAADTLKKQIKANLGSAAREIRIEANAQGGYRVLIVHPPHLEAGAMYQMIKHLPELADAKTTVTFQPQ